MYYFKSADGNIGDDINPWLWPQLLAPILDEKEEHLIVGIGTLLNHRIPQAKEYTVLTSGVGYGDSPEHNKGKWNFVGLRGPLSKEKLGIEKNLCLLDGAYLMPRFLKSPSLNKKFKYAYIPHVDSLLYGDWGKVCNLAGLKLLDPRWPVERFIQELTSCEMVITEAMHGAILADAYNIPWQPVKAYDYISDFKWQDWALSLDMSIKFNQLESIWKGDEGQALSRVMVNNVKRGLKSLGVYSKNWTPVMPRKSSEKKIENIAKQLIVFSETNEYFLTDDDLKNNKTDYLLEEIERLVLFHS